MYIVDDYLDDFAVLDDIWIDMAVYAGIRRVIATNG